MSKVDTLREKYKSIRETTFKSLSDGDVTPTKKYLERMCHYWTSKGQNKLYVSNLVNVIKDFDIHISYIQNKDIYSKEYETFHNLVKVVEDAKMLKFEKEFNRDEHVTVMYEDDTYLALSPKTFKGSMKYGANTRWCTSGKGFETTFKSYTKNNHLIYIINKKNSDTKLNKMALLFPKTKGIESIGDSIDNCYNPNDTNVQIRWFVNNGWNEDDLVKIITNVRLHCYKLNKFNSVKESVDNAVNVISSINLIELMNNINTLKSIDMLDDKETKGYKKTIDDFLSKITELNHSY
jgi:uncharacterized protein (UPF0305 family)